MKREAIKTKIAQFANTKAMPLGIQMMTIGTMVALNPILADGAAGSLLETVISILCKLVVALGVVLVIMGVIHYAAANSEGDGPAKHKAVMQIASGIMLAILSIALDTNKDAFVGILTD